MFIFFIQVPFLTLIWIFLMETGLYLNTVAPLQPFAKRVLTINEKISRWIYAHPKVVKVVKIAGLILGGASIALPPLGGAGIVICVVCGAIGGAGITISAIALKVLDILIPPKHDMKHHTFKPGQCEGGKLYYQGDVPILSITTKDPFKAGKAHGYLLGPSLNTLRSRTDFVSNFVPFVTKSKDIPSVIESVRKYIPERYIKEMEGFVDGFNQWAKEQRFRRIKKITLEDVIAYNMAPDSCHFKFPLAEHKLKKQAANPTVNQQKPALALACTVVIDRDEDGGFTFGRNMDWPSLGLAGAHSLVFCRHLEDGSRVVEVSVPGLIGTLTAMKIKKNEKSGLSLCMNVAEGVTTEVKGMPAVFLNRLMLETCSTAQEVSELVETDGYQPLGPYHLSVADNKDAVGLHLCQEGFDPTKRHWRRRWEQNKPLVVTNQTYGKKEDHFWYSKERKEVIDAFFTHAQQNINPNGIDRSKLVVHSLSLPYVNNEETTHRVVMQPSLGKISVAFDNSFAGDAKLHPLTVEQLFANQ